MATPAPNIAAVIQKMLLAMEENLDVDEFAPVVDDLRRLAAC